MKINRKSVWIWVAAIFVVNLLLKLLYIDARDVAMDEPFSIWWAQHSLPEIWQMLKSENNPALHFFLLHYWIKAFGISALSVRLPSVIFSAMTAGLVFLLAAKIFSKRTALFASVFFTLSTLQMLFAHEARVYAIFEFLALWNVYLVIKTIEQPTKNELFWWLLLCDILLVYSHYFGWLVVIMQTLWLLLHPERKNLWKSALTVLVVLMAAYTPNWITFFNRFSASASGTWVHTPDWTELYGNINRFVNSRYVSMVIIAMGLIGSGYFLFKHKLKSLIGDLRQNPTLIFLSLWFGGAWGLMFLASLKLPVFLDRYLLFLTPVLYIIIAGFFHHLKLPKWVGIFCNTGIAVCMLIFFQPNPDNHRRIGELTGKIRQMQTNESVVLISPEYAQLEFAYHYDRTIFAQYDSTTLRLQQNNIYPVRQLTDVPDSILNSADKIIYVDCGTIFALGSDATAEELKNKYTLTETSSVYSIYNITTFTSKP